MPQTSGGALIPAALEERLADAFRYVLSLKVHPLFGGRHIGHRLRLHPRHTTCFKLSGWSGHDELVQRVPTATLARN
eukprot:scaffold26463_cov25-Prasinocladus_malaysianus.AAC.3